MFIKLSKDTNKERLLTLIQSDELVIMGNDNGLEDVPDIFIALTTKDKSYISEETLSKYKNNPDVISATYILEYNGNALQGLTDEFVVKLKEATTLEQLQRLVTESNCLLVKENEFVKNQYLISVPKTSDLTSLQMANLFHETGLFEFAEPNFVIINAFGTGINNPSLLSVPDVLVYTPSGFSGDIVIKTKDDAINSVKIVDLTGQLVFSSAYPDATTIHLDKAYKQGIYIISVQLKSGRIVNQKVNLINNFIY
jgi:hypothetical protein